MHNIIVYTILMTKKSNLMNFVSPSVCFDIWKAIWNLFHDFCKLKIYSPILEEQITNDKKTVSKSAKEHVSNSIVDYPSQLLQDVGLPNNCLRRHPPLSDANIYLYLLTNKPFSADINNLTEAERFWLKKTD